MTTPSEQLIMDLAGALHWFGQCSCHQHGRQLHACPLHEFLSETDRRSVPITRPDRLVFVRAIRQKLMDQEGLRPDQDPRAQPQPPEDAQPAKLPW